MNIQFLYENGKGSVVDEYGRPEPMDYIVDEEQFCLKTLSSHTQYLAQQPLEGDKATESMQVGEDVKPDTDAVMRETSIKRNYTRYSDQDKVRFFKLLFKRCLSAAAAAKQLGIHVRTGQKWAEQYERDPNSIFEKRRKTGRPRILNEEHKKVILECIDENPSVVLDDMVKRLRQIFTELKVSKSTLFDFIKKHCNLSLKKARLQPIDRNSEEKIQERLGWDRKWEKTGMDFTRNCVFLDESAFHINLKRSMAWSKKGSPAVVTVPKTRAKTTTILGAISAQGLIKCSLRLPQPPPIKKRKRGEDVGRVSKGTVTGHYVSFLKATMDEMDQYPHMKGHYLVMDNAPIHTSVDIAKYVESRGYRCIYLPPYSPELNPIEQF
jgi:transposase